LLEPADTAAAWRSPGKISRELLLQELRTICAFAPGIVLEIGARTHYRGHEPFASAPSRWIKLDLDPRAMPQVVGSVYSMPFEANSVDTILCTQVIEHLTTPQAALVEMHRVLRKTGRLVLSAPQAWPLHMEPDDYFRYTGHGLTLLLTNAGFRIEQLKPCGHFFASIGLILSHAAFHLGFHARHSSVRHFWRSHGIVWINRLFLRLERRWSSLSTANVINWAVLARRE